MVVLRTLGTVELTDASGRELEQVLRQPKRLALLAYLALAVPRGFLRRDSLIALLWPELDQDHARAALRKAFFILRQEIGDQAIVTRADDEVRLSAALVSCDAVAFGEALDAGEFAKALTLYRGDLLPGFHVSETSAEWSQWLDAERARLRGRAAAAAWRLAEQREQERDATAARELAHRAAQLEPFDESAARRLMKMLDRLGDRSAAIRAFEAFARRLRVEMELEPSKETLALERSLRQPAPALDSNVDRPEHTYRDVSREALESTDKGGAGRIERVSGFVVPVTPAIHRMRWLWAVPISFSVLAVLTAGAMSWFGPVLRENAGSASLDRRRGSPTDPESGPPNSVAVLPVVTLGPEPASEYVGDGIAEELINSLGQAGFRVPARTSSFAFRGQSVSVLEIARRLRVRYLVEASLQKVDARLRITVRFIDGSDGYDLWHRTFERDSGDIFAIQVEIARSVAGALASGPTPLAPSTSSAPTPNRHAYDLYLLALAEARKPTAASKRRAIELLEDATREDPRFAQAHATLAVNYAAGPISGAFSWQDARDKAVAAARRALSLDSTLAGPHVAMGVTRFLVDWDWAGAEQALTRAIDLNPSTVSAHLYYCQVLAATGRMPEANLVMERMFALDPVSPGTNSTRGLVLHHLRRYDEAIAQYRQTIQIDSTYANAYVFLMRPLLATSRYAELRTVLQRWARLTGRIDTTDVTTVVSALGGSTPRRPAIQILARWQAEGGMGLTGTARIYARLGERALAIAALEEAFRQRDAALYAIAAEPLFDDLRSDTRFRRILDKMNLR